MTFQNKTVKVDRQITLYKRGDHAEPLWQARLRIKDDGGKGRYLFRSTGEADLEDARKAAYKILIQNETKISEGIPIFAPKFPKVWEQFIDEQQYQG